MERTTDTAAAAKRVASVTGFAIPVGRFRKLSGEPDPTEPRQPTALSSPLEPLESIPPTNGENSEVLGPTASGKVCAKCLLLTWSQVPESFNHALIRDHLSSLGDLESLAVGMESHADGGRHFHACVLYRKQIQRRPTAFAILGRTADVRCANAKKGPLDVHPELLDLCSEGGSDSSDSGESSDSEEVEECSVHGSSHDLCDAGCRTVDGFLVFGSPDGSSSEGGRDSEESDDVEEQEGEDGPDSSPLVRFHPSVHSSGSVEGSLSVGEKWGG